MMCNLKYIPNNNGYRSEAVWEDIFTITSRTSEVLFHFYDIDLI